MKFLPPREDHFDSRASLSQRDELCIFEHHGTRLALESTPSTIMFAASISCAPRVTHMGPVEARPGTVVNLSMEYLVGWPRVEISGNMMDWPRLKLGPSTLPAGLSARPRLYPQLHASHPGHVDLCREIPLRHGQSDRGP